MIGVTLHVHLQASQSKELMRLTQPLSLPREKYLAFA